MENKNSIGRFIAALRQAKGLTQRELGDLLFVSNKTVSRWERDECTPDLYLIPAIAEIFGITTDELLRGERKAGGDGDGAYSAAKSERQLCGILAKKRGRFKMLSFIPAGLAMCALIVCLATFNSELYYWLGMMFAAIFCSAGIICSVCFARAALFAMTEEYQSYAETIHAHNGDVMFTAAAVTMGDIAALFFCIPSVFFGGDWQFLVSWVLLGLFFAAGALIICFVVHFFGIRRTMLAAGTLGAVCEKERLNGRKRSILAAVWVVAIAAALCFLTAGLFISAGYTMLVLMLLAPVTLLAAAIAHVVINNKFIKKINKNN